MEYRSACVLLRILFGFPSLFCLSYCSAFHLCGSLAFADRVRIWGFRGG